jgi:lysophospholipase L1-like esterase
MCVLGALALLGACASDGCSAATGSGGSGGSSSSSGGSSSGGSTGTGGNPSGGNTAAGGNTASGGNTATGGNTASGGATGSGGASGGVNGNGASGGAGGNSASGGNTGSGGTATGSGGSAGAGTGGAGGSGGAAGGTSGASHWVGTWTASPYYDSSNPPPVSLSNSVVRQVTHVSLGGSQIRVQFSNLAGNGSVTISSAHVAICKTTPAGNTAAVDSTIDTTTDKALAFSGTASVTIAQGKEVWSDPLTFTLAPLANVTITTAFGTVPSQVTGHTGSRTTSYLQTASTNVSAASMTSATTIAQWFYISGMDVMADAGAKAIVAIGDSLTDGRGTDTDHNNRWTDDLAVLLQGNAATKDVAMLNQGIGATNLVGTGTAAQARFARDVLGQDGVRYAIVFDGVNDIGNGATAASLETVYASMISQAHAQKLLIYGATITPFGTNSYYTAAHEMVRQQVNTYIKSGVFDGYLDFDAAVTDGGNPPALQTQYDTWAQTDGLHLNPAGYQKLASSIDLTLFTK